MIAGANCLKPYERADTSKEVGDVDHLKVLAHLDLAEEWFKEPDTDWRCV